MADLFADEMPKIHPGRKLAGRVEAVLVGDGPGFQSRPVEAIPLDLEGVAGDGHRGFTRASGGREPWYPRGTEIRSGRQLSLLSAEELAVVAAALKLPAIVPGVLGANLVLSGIRQLSFLPAGTRLFFPGGACVVVEAQNAPCRHAGAALAVAHGRPDLETAYPKAAHRRRGLVASVERPGLVEAGAEVSVRVPEQWVYG